MTEVLLVGGSWHSRRTKVLYDDLDKVNKLYAAKRSRIPTLVSIDKTKPNVTYESYKLHRFTSEDKIYYVGVLHESITTF